MEVRFTFPVKNQLIGNILKRETKGSLDEVEELIQEMEENHVDQMEQSRLNRADK